MYEIQMRDIKREVKFDLDFDTLSLDEITDNDYCEWSADSIGDNNEFTTYEEANSAMDDLIDEWGNETNEFRIIEI